MFCNGRYINVFLTFHCTNTAIRRDVQILPALLNFAEKRTQCHVLLFVSTLGNFFPVLTQQSHSADFFSHKISVDFVIGDTDYLLFVLIYRKTS